MTAIRLTRRAQPKPLPQSHHPATKRTRRSSQTRIQGRSQHNRRSTRSLPPQTKPTRRRVRTNQTVEERLPAIAGSCRGFSDGFGEFLGGLEVTRHGDPPPMTDERRTAEEFTRWYGGRLQSGFVASVVQLVSLSRCRAVRAGPVLLRGALLPIHCNITPGQSRKC
jgi:hypothetical protein